MKPLSIAFVASEFVTEELWYGGLAAYLDKISSVLSEMGHRVEVFTESLHRETVSRNGVLVHRVPVGRGGMVHKVAQRLSRSRWEPLHLFDRLNRSWHLNASLMERHAERPFDVVQYASYLAVGALAPKRANGPATVSRLSSVQHLYQSGRGPMEAGPSPKDVEWRALRRTDAVFGPSLEMNAYAQEWLGREVATIPSPFVPIHSTSTEGMERRFVTFAGKLSLNKGIDRFVELGARLLERPGVEIAICGEIQPRDPAIEATMARLSERGGARVHVLGNLDRGTLGDVFARSLAVVLPSRVDNLPNVALEAMGAGAPIVAARGIGLDSLGVHGVAGILVDASRGEDLLEATNQVLDPARRSRFEAGCATVVTSLAPAAIGALHEELYRRTLSSAGRRRWP